jgi:hypothetical protein
MLIGSFLFVLAGEDLRFTIFLDVDEDERSIEVEVENVDVEEMSAGWGFESLNSCYVKVQGSRE